MEISGELNIYTAARWKAELLHVIHSEPGVELHLGEVNEFDSAGIQLLLLARREATRLNKALRLVTPSRCVLEALDLCQLRERFDIASSTADNAEAA